MDITTLLTIIITVNSTWSVAIISLIFKHERRLTRLEDKIDEICKKIHKLKGGKDEN